MSGLKQNRIFDGKTYSLKGETYSKKAAVKQAENLKDRGWATSIRIVKAKSRHTNRGRNVFRVFGRK